MARTINGIDELKALVGEELGTSDWLEITQERVNTFADATGDHQWIHVDPEKAKDGPFGGTIAHGYLTMSLGPVLLPQVVTVTGFSMPYSNRSPTCRSRVWASTEDTADSRAPP